VVVVLRILEDQVIHMVSTAADCSLEECLFELQVVMAMEPMMAMASDSLMVTASDSMMGMASNLKQLEVTMEEAPSSLVH